MKITNEVLYKKLKIKLAEKYKGKSGNEYCEGIIEYANKWADLMESAMENGQELKDVALDLSYEANTFNITGNMYGEAVKLLVYTWFCGEELRIIHNSKYNYSGEGIVNPAVILVDEETNQISHEITRIDIP